MRSLFYPTPESAQRDRVKTRIGSGSRVFSRACAPFSMSALTLALSVMCTLSVSTIQAWAQVESEAALKADSGSTGAGDVKRESESEEESETTRSEATGSEATGSETTGSETTGSETTGSEATGSEATASAAATAPVLTKRPLVTEFVDAEYPESAKAEQVEASVILTITIDASGVVTEAEVTQSSNSTHPFDQAALVAAKRLRFSPAEFNGKPGPVRINFKYEFAYEREVVEVETQSERGRLSGLILERGTRRPLSGVLVRLTALELEEETDEKGRFVFDDVEPGEVNIEIDSEEHYTQLDIESVTAKQETVVKYYLEPKAGAGDTTVVSVGRRAKKEVAKRTITMQEIRKIPGTQGDALKVVQNLPGVARIPFGGGGLVIRGSNPGDSGSTINRHFIPLVFHFGGLRSIFPSELLESIEFYPGNFTPEFGRYTGGIVDARFRKPRGDRLHARVEADIFDAGFLIEGPVTENSSFAISGRRSYIDAALSALPEGAVSFVVAPRYYDYQALYDWKKGKHRVRLYFFGSDDKLKLVLNNPAENNPGVRGNIENETSLMRIYGAWDYPITPRLDHHLSVATGQNHLGFALGDQLSFNNDVNVVTLRDELTWRSSDRKLTLRGGFEGEAYLGKIKLKLPQNNNKEGQAGRAPISTLDIKQANRDFEFYNPGLWLEAQWQPNKRLTLTPGARFDYDTYLGDFAPDPRLNARYVFDMSDEGAAVQTLKLGVGRYSQRPAPDETDSTYGNPDLLLEHSAHFSLGYEVQLTEALNLDIVSFYKHLYGSVSPIPDPLLRYDNNGAGRIYGLEVLLKHASRGRFFGWVSYTLMRSERKDSGAEDFRLFSLDQTHILTLIAQYKLSAQWEIGARFRYTTGNPQTPYVSAIYDADADAYVPIPGAVNSTRVDSFQQLDIRLDRKWIFDTWMFTAYLEIQNALNRANPEGQNYNYNFTQSQVITSLPIIPSIGLRGEL